jgi:hypothetical protein
MPVPDQVRDDGFGIQKRLNLLDSAKTSQRARLWPEFTFYEFVNFGWRKKVNLRHHPYVNMGYYFEAGFGLGRNP